MKRTLSTFIITTLLFTCSVTAIFADDGDHTHEWSDWEVEELSSCDERGYEIRYCIDCDETETRWLPYAPHDWSDWEVVRAATPYKAGVMERSCYVCDETQTKSIAKKKLTNNQKKAVKAVNKYLKSAKKYNYSAMYKCFAKKNSKYGYPTSKYYKKLFKNYNKKIKWEILKATGKGNTIKVKAKVTYPDYYEAFYKAFYKTCEWCIYHQNAGESAIGKYFNNKVKVYIKKYKNDTYTENITFTVVKTKKGWKLKTNTDTIVDIACGYFNQAVEDARKDFIKDYTF